MSAPWFEARERGLPIFAETCSKVGTHVYVHFGASSLRETEPAVGTLCDCGLYEWAGLPRRSHRSRDGNRAANDRPEPT